MQSVLSCCKLFLRFFVYGFILITTSYAQIIPTDTWINFYSSRTLFHGAPIPVGAVVDAYDPDGVHCGRFTVTSEGEYGFLIVYGDDILTPTFDEGATPGDTISFKINGVDVKTLGPDANVWIENGDILEVDLADNLPPKKKVSIADVVLNEDDPDTVIADLDTIFFDPDQDSLWFSSLASDPGVITPIDLDHRLIISLAPNWYGSAQVRILAQDLWFTVADTIQITVGQKNDRPQLFLPDTLSFLEDQSKNLDLSLYVLDPEEPDSLLSWNYYAEAGILIVVDSATHIARFSGLKDWFGSNKVIFTVSDTSGSWDLDTMSVLVLPINDAPVIINLPDTSFSNDTTLTINLNDYVEDVDHEKSTLIWQATVPFPYHDSLNITINKAAQQATFSAPSHFSGRVPVLFTVSDDSSGSDSDTMMVNIVPPSRVNASMTFIPTTYALSQNYPNPFNAVTMIKYQLPQSSHVAIHIYNFLGQKVATLIDEPQKAGFYSLCWNAREMSSGVYLIRFQAGEFSTRCKMLLVR